MSGNPYLQDQGNAITSQVTNNLQNNVLPGINSGAAASGGFGGSRHGIAQGMAIGQTNQGLSNSLAGLYGNAYESDANRAQQKYGMDQQSQLGNKQADNSYNLGMGQLGLGAQTANQNFFTQQRGQDYQGMQLGMQMANQGNQGLANQGGQLWQNGQNQQNAPWQNLQNFQNSLAPFTGLNGSSSTSNPGFSGLQGAMAGGMTAAQLWAMLSGGQQRPGG